jgi:type I restriction enzyme S subunit
VAKLMPYEEYKKTGLDWIDEIPTHWKIKHTRYLWKERKETNYVEEQLLSVTINNGIHVVIRIYLMLFHFTDHII